MNTIIIGGKTINAKGKSVSIINGRVLVDGKDISDLNEVEEKEINITIDGNIEKLEIESRTKVQVNGDAQNVKTTAGDVDVKGNVSGNIQTISGDVNCSNVGGSISTMSGDISHK